MNSRILNNLRDIAMNKVEQAQFMDRIDARYLLPKKNLEEILGVIQPHYQLLHLRGKRLFRYDTLYFDTPERLFYHQYISGRLKRYKIRSRRYVETDENYFELKCRNNKRNTITQRVRLDDLSEDICDYGKQLLTQNVPIVTSGLKPALWVYYHRFMLVNPETNERLTFDANVWFRWQSQFVAYPNLIIADVQHERGYPSPFRMLMKKMELREGGISKYCLGLANVEPSLKINTIKPILSKINQITNY
ncbi:polyphosphate polymerase domain-containing protein [Runella sp.]|uniref:polyphosphate polymerase domain-containing protein n=1 Tax=Runella sp. TaxID=1960881 RepID=UPI003D0E8825